MKSKITFYLKGLIIVTLLLLPNVIRADDNDILPVRGFCIAAPAPAEVDRFVKFIEEELAPRNVNVLILRVDYRYQYKSHQELVGNNPLSKSEVRKLVRTCRKNKIRIIPQVNLLGHQSWHSTPSRLLEVYPEFDETPDVELPEDYTWPNKDGLYCKSYCPLHPDVHSVVFDIVDEICKAFCADAFHAGMDEVFYIGMDQCERCKGKDRSELFAGEVSKIRDHLAKKDRELWIWGDRLLDGETTGLGMWEASKNDTYRAVDMIPDDVFICDWHYTRADPTPVYFAVKGLNVAACPYKSVATGTGHVENMVHFRSISHRKMKDRLQGVIQTVWSGCGNFMDEYYGNEYDPEFSESACFIATFERINSISEVE